MLLENTPLVSVIVPCYNQAEYLSEALESVFNQTYQNWECIIVNDGSTDYTENIAKEWCEKDKRFIYLKKENGGLSSARNAGIKSSSGDYILPLDADDLICREYLHLAIDVFQKDENIKLVYGKAEIFGQESGVWSLPQYCYARLLEDNLIYCSAVYKRLDYDNTLGYDEKLKTGYEDWDFWLQLLSENDVIHFINDFSVFFYRIKQSSMLKEINNQNAKSLRQYIYGKHKLQYEKYWDDPILLKRKNREFIAMYKNSTSYKIGELIISPLRKIKNLF